MKKIAILIIYLFVTVQVFAVDVTISIPSNQSARILAALGAANLAEAKAKIIDYIVDTVYAYEQNQAVVVANDAAQNQVDEAQAAVEAITKDNTLAQ